MSKEVNTCIICKGEATVKFGLIYPQANPFWDGYLCDCARCCRYVLDERLAKKLSQATDGLAFRLACLLREDRQRVEPRRVGIFSQKDDPEDNAVKKELKIWWHVDDLLARFPKPTQMVDRCLVNLSRRLSHPIISAKITKERLPFLVFSPPEAAFRMIAYMASMGLVVSENETQESMRIAITPAGWERLAQLRVTSIESRQAFVAMWFDESTRSIFEDGIHPAVQKANYEPIRIDNKEHNNKICDEIIGEIRKSRFVVADFTAGVCKHCPSCGEEEACRDKVRPRGGVYFEAGFALGLGIPVIWTVRNDQVEQVHFDTRQYNHIVYESAEGLRDKLYNRIAATIR